MQFKLKPIPPSELEEILIDDAVFSIGRGRRPFSKYAKEQVANLSRVHARIIEKNENIFVIDAGSKNGTYVNNKRLDRNPVQLKNGDIIGFSDSLVYALDIPNQIRLEPRLAEPATEIILTLMPADNELETLVVSKFPFLISKSDKTFAAYASKFSEDLRYLSRRHAYFFVKENELYVEDLKSTNGTYVNGIRLDDTAILLKNGDAIEIGSNRFSYTIDVKKALQPEKVSQVKEPSASKPIQSGPVADDRTTFVSTADSFLDIFCPQDEDADTPINEEYAQEVSEVVETKPAKTAFGRFFRRTRAFFGQVNTALAEEKRDSRKTKWVFTVMCIAAVIAAGFYWFGVQQRDINTLMAEGRYEQSLILALKYLEKNPEHEEIRKIAAQALIKSTVPPWLEEIEQQEYEEASQLLMETKRKYSLQGEGLELIGVLEWMGILEQFIHDRGGIKGPIIIFSQEKQINTLLNWWEEDKQNHLRSLTSIKRYAPEFNSIYSRTYSHLTALRKERSVDIAAIDRLKATIRKKLASNRGKELSIVFDKFESKYPKIQGMDKVREDWQSYMTLKREVDARNLPAILSFLSKHQFVIPPFKESLEAITANSLPSGQFVERYAQASAAWRAGEMKTAIDLLMQLKDPAWDEFIVPELKRKQQIKKTYSALLESRNKANYESALASFYSLLDKDEDSYFVNAIEVDFKEIRNKGTTEAEKFLELAQKNWIDYKKGGRIRGLQRLEAGISRKFKKQALHLFNAYLNAHQGIKLYNTIATDPAPEWKEMYDDIKAEIASQRRSLDELSMVLEPKLLDAKLKLIPKP
ncbi:MAG: FHA domain-containing protein [Methylococcales bacterium]